MKNHNWMLYLTSAFAILLLTACGTGIGVNDEVTVVVYRSPTCGCCSDWVAHLETNGYSVQMNDVDDMAVVKEEYRIPLELQSCHTAIVDGYIIEGHIPAETIDQLLAERPDIYGLAVPGMPVVSPGMESSTGEKEPYNVYVFDPDGPITVFTSFGT